MTSSPLQDLPCFSVYAASRSIVQTYRAVLADLDLTYTQFLVLTALDRLGDSSVQQLGEAMFLDSGTLSPVLKRMEKRELLARERKQHDERVVVIRLTDLGRTVLAEAQTAVGCMATGYAFESQQEFDDLLAVLHRITSGMSNVTSSLRAGDSAPVPA